MDNKDTNVPLYNIMDKLQYESAISDFKECYEEFNKVNNDFILALEMEDNITNNLTNESALTGYLNTYGYLTSEKADALEIGAKALREIKEMIKRIVAKFLEVFGKLKEYIIKVFSNNDTLIESLEKKIKSLGESKQVYSLDHESFNHHLPTIKDFGNNTEIHNLLTELAKSANNLKSYGSVAVVFKNPDFKKNQEDLIECTKNKLSYLKSNDEGKLKITTESTQFKDSDLKSRLLTKDNLLSMLNKVSSFESLMKKYMEDLDYNTKRLEKADGVTNEDINSHPHFSNNIRVILEANGKFGNNIIHVTKGVLFVIASNIKCYENN